MPENTFVNPLDLLTEVDSPTILVFTEGKFMLVKLSPPKAKTIENGLVATLALISFYNEAGEETVMVKVEEGTSGYEVSFPYGKRGILATKYRGPKSYYKFYGGGKQLKLGENDPTTGINPLFTADYAKEYLAEKLPNWNELSDAERNSAIDEYLESMFMFGLAKDFNLNPDIGVLPAIGMVSKFYRRYTPPKEGEKYGNVIVTKYATKEGKPNIDGEYTLLPADIATLIYEELTKRDEDTKFDPTQLSTDEVI